MDKNCFRVDEEKCIHCGLCEKDCIENIIKLNENKVPYITDEKLCFHCQHCMAVCPTGAISIDDKSPENSDEIWVQYPDVILNLMKSRRSCRNYKQENVNDEKMNNLKNMLKWVPTGCNYHSLHFTFIDDIDVMNDFRNYVNTKLMNILKNKPVSDIAKKFSPFAKAFLEGEDVIFRGAPHMIIATNSIKAPCAQQDPIIALSYFELYAQSLGLGTCWCGLGEMCLKSFPELCDYLKIPEGYQASYTMLFGEKDIEFKRCTQPDEISIVSAEKGDIEKLSVCKKAKRYFWNFIR